MSHLAWRAWQRKKVLERSKELRIVPKLSPEVEQGLRELRQMEKEA